MLVPSVCTFFYSTSATCVTRVALMIARSVHTKRVVTVIFLQHQFLFSLVKKKSLCCISIVEETLTVHYPNSMEKLQRLCCQNEQFM